MTKSTTPNPQKTTLLALGASLCALGIVFMTAIDQTVVGIVFAVAGAAMILLSVKKK